MAVVDRHDTVTEFSELSNEFTTEGEDTTEDDSQETAEGKKSRNKNLRRKASDSDFKYLCEWNNCAHISFSMNEFNHHVSRHRRGYTQCLGSDQEVASGEYIFFCQWQDCNASIEGQLDDFSRHVFYHTFHQYLKFLGEHIQRVEQLSPCMLDTTSRNVIPELPEKLMCRWMDCGMVYDNPYIFYSHVTHHCEDYPKSTESNLKISCQWEGCSATTKSWFKMKEHIRSHTQAKVVACPICGSLFASNTRYIDHLERQSQDKELKFECSHCNSRFGSERILRDHMRHHVNHYKCPLCDMTCHSPSAVRDHVRYRHSEERGYQCLQCDYRAKTPTDLRRHAVTHIDKKVMSCCRPDCDEVFTEKRYLMRHYFEKHKGTAHEYECHICSKSFSRGTYLSQHLIEVHRYKWPSGHRRFRYKLHDDGIRRLQTIRYESIEVSQQVLGQTLSPHPNAEGAAGDNAVCDTMDGDGDNDKEEEDDNNQENDVAGDEVRSHNSNNNSDEDDNDDEDGCDDKGVRPLKKRKRAPKKRRKDKVSIYIDVDTSSLENSSASEMSQDLSQERLVISTGESSGQQGMKEEEKAQRNAKRRKTVSKSSSADQRSGPFAGIGKRRGRKGSGTGNLQSQETGNSEVADLGLSKSMKARRKGRGKGKNAGFAFEGNERDSISSRNRGDNYKEESSLSIDESECGVRKYDKNNETDMEKSSKQKKGNVLGRARDLAFTTEQDTSSTCESFQSSSSSLLPSSNMTPTLSSLLSSPPLVSPEKSLSSFNLSPMHHDTSSNERTPEKHKTVPQHVTAVSELGSQSASNSSPSQSSPVAMVNRHSVTSSTATSSSPTAQTTLSHESLSQLQQAVCQTTSDSDPVCQSPDSVTASFVPVGYITYANKVNVASTLGENLLTTQTSAPASCTPPLLQPSPFKTPERPKPRSRAIQTPPPLTFYGSKSSEKSARSHSSPERTRQNLNPPEMTAHVNNSSAVLSMPLFPTCSPEPLPVNLSISREVSPVKQEPDLDPGLALTPTSTVSSTSPEKVYQVSVAEQGCSPVKSEAEVTEGPHEVITRSHEVVERSPWPAGLESGGDSSHQVVTLGWSIGSEVSPVKEEPCSQAGRNTSSMHPTSMNFDVPCTGEEPPIRHESSPQLVDRFTAGTDILQTVSMEWPDGVSPVKLEGTLFANTKAEPDVILKSEAKERVLGQDEANGVRNGDGNHDGAVTDGSDSCVAGSNGVFICGADENGEVVLDMSCVGTVKGGNVVSADVNHSESGGGSCESRGQVVNGTVVIGEDGTVSLYDLYNLQMLGDVALNSQDKSHSDKK